MYTLPKQKNWSVAQFANAAQEVILWNEGWDGEPIDPHYFLGLVLKHMEEFGADDHVRTYEEIDAMHKATRKAPAPVGPAPKKNDIVRVLRGQGKGWECKVFWVGEKEYNGKKVLRIGMKNRENFTLWATAENVEIVK